ncbi:hypothetical protein [Pseudoalteromonas sp. JC3]|uniref:hypothetical protein n=1 Tax=Pseudoalteromonas sp. JC3 TaxID=2810196 RepID=UPI0019D29669|nr:hypothetical protein [Pseudoalteromonas sp. JC3]MBR8842485.1 hypothetical protein [Pseudoalteromonas sp. JC3]WJE09397.1 hypothetical protein QSH61_02695 [Pseudoalteromonas sp. JC3]
MKLFKKALLATAIVGAFGANAATVTSDPVKLSAEGVANKLSAPDVAFDVDFVIGKETAAASKITLTFDKTISVADLNLNTGVDNVINVTADGKGYITADGQKDANGQPTGTVLVTFDYGTGSFTFDKFKVNDTNNSIEFVVNLGNPLTANSAFRMSFATDAGVDFSGAGNVAYKSTTVAGAEIETGTGVLATTANQFAFNVKAPFNGLIERLEKDTFSKNSDSADKEEDKLVFELSNNESSSLQAHLTATTHTVVLEGNFNNGGSTTTVPATQIADGDFDLTNAASASVGTVTLGAVGSTANQKLTLTLPTANVATTGAKVPFNLVFDSGNAKVIPETKDILASYAVTVSDAGVTDPITVAQNVAAGKWALDATIINIPYFPVGFTGLSTSVHFANESTNAADVIVEAIDGDGKEYKGTLDDLAGNTVTKVGQDKVMKALGLDTTKSYKLSVTFNIDANTGDVNAYAFSNAGDARQALVTSQQKGSDK